MTEKHHRSAVSLKQTVGEFIIRRLKEAGISHMFGVPGDYNLEFLEQVEDVELQRCSTLAIREALLGLGQQRGFQEPSRKQRRRTRRRACRHRGVGQVAIS